MRSNDPYDPNNEDSEVKSNFITKPDKNEKEHEFCTREQYHRNMQSSLELQDLNSSFNSFSNRKTFTTGLLDLTLLTSNFVQMKNLIITNKWTPINVILMMFIIISIGMQISCGVVLIFAARNFDEFTNAKNRRYSIRINNVITLLVLFISILNIFISVFTSF